MRWSYRTRYLFVPIALLVFTVLSVVSVGAGEEKARKLTEIQASLWDLSKENGNLTLATMGQSAPVKTTLTAQTQLEGVCMHCQISLKCCSGDLGKRCPVCPCGFSNAICLAGKAASEKNGPALLQALPRGTRLRVEYLDGDKPEAGLKRLVVDLHGVLLPVEGLADATPDQLQTLGRSVGAVRTELSAEGKRLQLTLKDNWTAERATRLEKALEKQGAKIASLPPEPTTP
jgi:hypothetical protein